MTELDELETTKLELTVLEATEELLELIGASAILRAPLTCLLVPGLPALLFI